MKLKNSAGEDGENKGHAFILSLRDPISTEAMPAHQERARRAALVGLTTAMETVSRYDLPLRELDVARDTYGRAWQTLNALNVEDPSTTEVLLRISVEIRTARDDLVRALASRIET